MAAVDEAVAQAETAVLGALLLEPDALRLVPHLHPSQFLRPAHGTILGAIRDAHANGGTDAIAVMETLSNAGDLDRVGGGAYLHQLTESVPLVASIGYYARIVTEAARRRQIGQMGIRLQQIAETPADYTAVADNTLATIEALQQVVSAPEGADDAIDGLAELGSLVDTDPEPYDWLVPGLLERLDRVLVVASEGAGKSMLARQVAVLLSQGRHPFKPDMALPYAPKTLIVDLENPPKLVQRKCTSIVERCRSAQEWRPRCYVWTRPGGLNLRRPAEAALLERVISEVRPAFVALGPLYKAGFVAGGEAAERTASEVAAVLDRLRERYRLTWWLEHHAPMEQQGQRNLRPFGSGLWARWPEFGLALRKDRDRDPSGRTLAMEKFRGDRDERSWPVALQRGSLFPWEPIYDEPQEWS